MTEELPLYVRETPSIAAQRNHWIDFRGPPRRNPTRQQCNPHQQRCDHDERQRIGRAHAIQQTLYQARRGIRRQQAKHNARERQPQPLRDDESQHVTRFGAERHADADLAPALADRKRQHAVETEHAQKEGQRPGPGQHGARQLDGLECGIDKLAQRHGFAERNLRVYGHNHTPQAWEHRLWVARHAYQQARVYLRSVLPVRQVEKRLLAIERIVQQRIFTDANHLIWLVIQNQGTFQRPALRPQAARQHFVDDGHARRAGSVSLIKLTPFEERDLHRFEEAGRDFAKKHSQLIFRALRRLFRRPDAHLAAGERGHPYAADHRHGLHTGSGFKAARHFARVRLGFLRTVVQQHWSQPKHHDLFRIEVCALVDIGFAAHKQARRHQQRQRQRYLPDDERAPQPMASRMLRSAVILQSARQVVTCRLKRGRQTEQKSRTQRESERINYGAWTQAQIV